MNREEVIRMAREAGFAYSWSEAAGEALERFAALVAAAEREACAKFCDEREEIFQKYYTKGLPALCASAIRARGEK